MQINLKIGNKRSAFDLEEGSSVSSLLEKLAINRETVLVRVNKEIVVEEEMLEKGDEVEIIRAVSGG